MSELPPYTPAGVPAPDQVARHRMAGPVQTCSIQDQQHDYFRITQQSSTSYQIGLTADPTPLYRVEISQGPGVVAEIQLFKAFGDDTALAACRISCTSKPTKGKNTKEEFVTTICTSQPLSEAAQWRQIQKSVSLAHRQDYEGNMALVMVPGCRHVERSFAWRLPQRLVPIEPDVELWLKDPLPYPPHASIDRQQLFARYWHRGTAFYEKGVLEMRRGGGLQFEFGVVLSALAVLELQQRKTGGIGFHF